MTITYSNVIQKLAHIESACIQGSFLYSATIELTRSGHSQLVGPWSRDILYSYTLFEMKVSQTSKTPNTNYPVE